MPSLHVNITEIYNIKGVVPFFVLPTASYDMISDYPWFEQYNPHINWHTHSITACSSNASYVSRYLIYLLLLNVYNLAYNLVQREIGGRPPSVHRRFITNTG